MSDEYTVIKYHHERPYDADDDELVDEEQFTTDLDGALDALAGDYWDHQDWRGDEVILYPADPYWNMRTGLIETTHTVIRATEQRMTELWNESCRKRESV